MNPNKAFLSRREMVAIGSGILASPYLAAVTGEARDVSNNAGSSNGGSDMQKAAFGISETAF